MSLTCSWIKRLPSGRSEVRQLDAVDDLLAGVESFSSASLPALFCWNLIRLRSKPWLCAMAFVCLSAGLLYDRQIYTHPQHIVPHVQ